MAKITVGFTCPCGAWTKVLETRGTIRRRECANFHRFNTEEVIRGPSGIPFPKIQFPEITNEDTDTE